MSYQQQKFKEIADKIREKTGTTDLIKPSDFASKIDDVFAAGAASAPPVEGDRYDEGYADGKDKTLHDFWYSYQNGGGRNNYMYAFCLMNSRDFYPLYDIIPTSNQSNHMFRNFNMTIGSTAYKDFDLAARLEEQGISLDFSNCTTTQLPFAYCNIIRIPECDFSNCTTTDRCYYDIKNLERIDRVIGSEKTSFYGNYGTSFYKLPKLTYIRFGGIIGGVSNVDLSGSPLLEARCFTAANENGAYVDVDGIEIPEANRDGLFDCLADKTGDTSKQWSCTIGTDNLNKLTEAQKAIATGKGWILA